MSIKDIINVFKRRFLLILMIWLLVSLAIGLAFSYIVKPSYESSEYLLVGDLQTAKGVSSYEEAQKIPQIIASSVDFIQSPFVLATVENQMNLVPSTLKDKLAVENNKDSQLITITVVDKDPQKAKEIANALAVASIQKMNDVMQFNQVTLLQKNSNVNEKSNVVINYILAVIVGFLAGAGVALILEQFDDSVKNEHGVEALIGAPILGTLKNQVRKPSKREVIRLKERREIRV